MKAQVENEENYNRNITKFYNMVVKINSMEQLKEEGWNIIKNNIDEKYKQKRVSITSVIGNKNSGKSFILHLLTGKNIPNGFTVTTEGISFIIPDDKDNKDDNFILIDSAGTESPLLIENKNYLKEDKINKMAKDRQITDYFLQKFILEKSDIFICVIDNLTLTDQKFINRIVKNYTNKTIFIIHNLKTFIEKSQVEDYINNTLMESLTFQLKKDEYFELINNSENDIEQNHIFFKQKLKENNRTIVHLIIANEDSQAGKYYNKSTIKYLRRQLEQVKVKKSFDIIENIKDFLISFSGEIFEKKLDENSLTVAQSYIKLKKNISLELKDCLIDELGNNIIKDTKYIPKYRYGYFTDSLSEERKFFLEIELFGIWEISHGIKINNNNFIIKIKGVKKKKIFERNYEFCNYIPNNEFEFEIKIDSSKGIVKDDPKAEEENGLYILIFSIRKEIIEEEVVSEENNEEENEDGDV